MNDTRHTLINLDYVELMSGGDKDMQRTLLEMVLQELPQELALQQEHARTQSWEALGEISHKMKSTLAFVGNEQLTEWNKQVEQNAKRHQDLDKIPELVAQIGQLAPRVIEALKAALDEMR
ncbi:MAG: Hpt domain-containing protein [Bacteroidetes bacterium]|nr:MAG: Hpt domain-containing protein [Bacteroidota bacterium]